MKWKTLFNLCPGMLFSILLLTVQPARSQGKALINEYLPWPNNACGVTAEFIELLNFGPGPMNIGCYIITDGDFSITIPPNTILQPGQFYVLAGQNIIPQNCGNDFRNVTVNLNWTTCGCTSTAIPVTGDGLMTDGGSGNEQLVLLDPNLKIVDAVARSLPVEPSAVITTSSMGGICAVKTFDLDTMNVQYETIGESTGRGNSMAREIDGGCRWIKDTQESAGDTNNTTSSSFAIDASLSITEGQTCSNTGAISIAVLSGNMSQIFPVRYTLALDADSNNIFDFADTYSNGIDSTATTVPITGLTWGKYRLLIGTQKDCDLTPFDFVILNCANVILPQLITDIKLVTGTANAAQLVWNFPERELVQSFDIEESMDGNYFYRIASISDVQNPLYRDHFFYPLAVKPVTVYYRVRLTSTIGKMVYSSVIKSLAKQDVIPSVQAFPNPVINSVTLRITATLAGDAQLLLADKLGMTLLRHRTYLQPGINTVTLPVDQLPAGIYSLSAVQHQAKLGVTIKIIKARK